MKRSEKINRFVMSLMMFVYITALLPAQEISYTIQESKKRLDYYLDKAENEYEELSWEEKVETGLQEALLYWESENTYLKEKDYEEYLKQKNEAQVYLELEKNKSYVEWLCNKLSKSSSVKLNNELTQKIKEARETYNTDGFTLNEVNKLQESWNTESEKIINEYLDKVDEENLVQIIEIKNRLKEKGINSDETDKIFNNITVNNKEYIKNENYLLTKSEGSKLILRFVEDKDSIKAEKAKEAAKVIAREIADRAYEESNIAMESLFTELEKTLNTENVAETEVTELLENFKTAFNEGLAIWEEAETEFLKNRQEWEAEAELTYQKSQEKWEEAYTELKNKRTEWETKIIEQIKNVQNEIVDKNTDYEKQIAQMYEAYEIALQNDKEQKMQIAQSQINMYYSLRSALAMSKQGIESWYKIWNSHYKGVYSYWKTEANGKEDSTEEDTNYEFDVEKFDKSVADELKEELAKIVNGWCSPSNNTILEMFGLIKSESTKFYDTIQKNKDKFENIDNPLKEDLSNLDEIITILEIENNNSELVKKLNALKSVIEWMDQILYYKGKIRVITQEISEITESNPEFKSELELEINEAEKQLKYWKEELYVAEQVEQYAQTTDASRESATKTLEDMNQAEQNYNDALSVYEGAVTDINTANEAVVEAAKELDNINEQLNVIKAEIEKLNTEYQALIAIEQGVDIKNVVQKIKMNIDNYEEVLRNIQTIESEIYFVEAALSQNNEYEDLKEIQSIYETLENDLLLSLDKIKKNVDAENKKYYDIYNNLNNLNIGDAYAEELCKIKETVNALDEILLKGEYTEEYKEKSKELYTYIIKQEIDYIIESENVKLNAALGNKKVEKQEIIYKEKEWNLYVNDILTILNFDKDTNSEQIDKINKALKDTENTKDILEADEELKTLLTRSYVFSDSALQSYYELLVSVEKSESELNKKLINNMNKLDEQGRLYNAEYRKTIFEENRIEIGKKINEEKEVNSGYESVIDYVISLYDLTLNSSETTLYSLNNYMDAYVKKEAFRYRANENYNEDSVKTKIKELLPIIESFDDKNATEDDFKTYVENTWTLKFLNYAEKYTEEYNNWYEKIKDTTFCSSEYLSDEDKEKYASLIYDWEEKLQSELDNQVNYEKKYFESAIEEIENIKTNEVSITTYNQNKDLLIQLKSSLLENIEIYTKYNFNNENIKTQTQDKKNKISDKEKEYQKKQTEFEEKVNNLLAAGKTYNEKVNIANQKYEDVLEKRKELRAKQAVYDWAESIYLENMGNTEENDYVTPKEKVSLAKYAYDRAKLSLSILTNLKETKEKESDTEKIKEYKDKDKLYYESYVIYNELEEKINDVLSELAKSEQELEYKRSEIFGQIEENTEEIVVKGIKTEIKLDENGKIIDVTYLLDKNAETTEEYFTKVYKNENGQTVTLDEIAKTACEIEAEQWLIEMMKEENKAYFEKVVAAALYYELFEVSAEERERILEEKGSEVVYAVLNATDLDSFAVEGYKKAHGNNVGEHFYDYVKGYLESAYKEVVASGASDIAKCLLFQNTNGVYGSNVGKLEMYLVKINSYEKLESWINGIENEFKHRFTKKFLWGLFRGWDAEGKWAEEASNVISEQHSNDIGMYREQYDEIYNKITELQTAKNKVEESRKNYYMALTGLEDGNTKGITGKNVKTKIKELLSDQIKETVNLDEILSKISDEKIYDNIITAMVEVLSSLKNEATLAKEEMDKEQESLYFSQSINGNLYKDTINKGLTISEEDNKTLRQLALKASDLTLTITERNAAAKAYDELYARLNVDNDKSILEIYAEAAWGKNTYDSKKYVISMDDLYKSYIYGEESILTNENRIAETYIQELYENWMINYEEALNIQNSSKMNEYIAELEYSLDSFTSETEEMLNQLYDISNAAKNEWNKAEEKLNVAYNTWQRDFLKGYNKNIEEWEGNYEEFLEEKQEWITTMYVEAANQTAYTGEEKTAETVAKSLNKAKQVAIEEMQEVSIDTESLVNELLGETNLGKIEKHFEDVKSRIGNIKGITKQNTSNAAQTIAGYYASQKMATEITTRMEATASKIAAMQAVENLEANIKQSYEMVDAYNQNYEDYIKELVLGAGYDWTKTESTRRVVVDTSLAGNKYENQKVKSYEWYKAVMPEVTISTTMLADLEGESLILAMTQDEKDLEEWRERILGEDGEINKHVGEAGKLKEDIDVEETLEDNIEDPGTGQMGSIILNFQWNEIQKNKGIAELAKPTWDQKLWCGDFIGIEAPSIRTVATVAASAAAAIVGAVATPFTGGSSGALAAAAISAMSAAAIGAAITFTNEALFAMLDLAGEYKTPEEIGKQLASSAVSSAISILGAGAGSAVSGLSGFGGVLAKTGVSAATSVTSTVAVNAIQYAGDWDGFVDSLNSIEDWQGCISSTVGSFVTNGLGEMNLGTGNMKVDGFNTKQIDSIGKLNSLAGGLASTAITYGITGEATFNVLNIADFMNPDPNSKLTKVSSGLFEVSLSKDKGFSARLGTGGVDLSFKNVKSAISGLKAVNTNIQINKVAKQSNMNNVATALRVQYGFGDETQLSNLDSILKGQSVIKAGNGAGEAQTITENGKRTIYLNNYKENMTREEKLAMGITIGHEAYRDGITSDAQSQYIETVNAVLGHTVMAKKMQNDDMYNNIMTGIINTNQTLKKDIAAFDQAIISGDWSEFGKYVGKNYDSSADYWKLVKQENGKYGIQYDGFHSLYDADGNLLIRNEMDEFDKLTGENKGSRDDYNTYNSYAASLGMLLGTYTNYMNSEDDYKNNWNKPGNKELRQTSIDLLRDVGVRNIDDLKNINFVVDSNPYLMTNIGIISGSGITYKHLADGIFSQSVSIKDEYNNEVGTINNLYNPKTDKTNIIGIENMIPEGKRFKAGMIIFEDGNISLYGLSSTMPDPNKMGQSHPALLDGEYTFSYSLHNPGKENAYPAMRIYDTLPISWNQVIGSKGGVEIKGFPYSTGEWGKNQKNTPGYYYDENGAIKYTTTNYINYHKSNLFSFTPSYSGNYGGSDGCQIQHPYTYDDMTKNFYFKQNPVYGYYKVNRSFFGDGTNGKNNWKDWK